MARLEVAGESGQKNKAEHGGRRAKEHREERKEQLIRQDISGEAYR